MLKRLSLGAFSLGFLFAFFVAGGAAQAQVAVCTPTQTVQAGPSGRYVTVLTCANTAAAPGAADYRHLHYNQAPSPAPDVNPEDRDASIANNAPDNDVMLTIGSNLVFTADGTADMRILPFDAAIALWRGGAKTVAVENGAVIELRRTPGGSGGNYQGFIDILSRLAAIYVASEAGDGGLTVRHDGAIDIRVDIQGIWGGAYPSNSGHAITAVVDGDGTAGDDDILIRLGSTGVIRQVSGSEGLGGVSAINSSRDGDVTFLFASGSTIDLTEAGGSSAVAAAVSAGTGNIVIDAAGTIRNAVKSRTISSRQGVGIRAHGDSSGSIRVRSSGTVETWQAPAIYVSANGEGQRRDDPATREIEGNLVDVTAGTIHTRGQAAIAADTDGAGGAWTIRVAQGATVRADRSAGTGAVAESAFGTGGNFYVSPSQPGWRLIDTDNNGVNDALEPIVSAIYVAPSEEAAARAAVIVLGTVRTVGGKDGEDAAVFLGGGGTLLVGATGRILAPGATSSGLGVLAEGTRDFRATVAGEIDGDLRAAGSGLNAVTVTPDGSVSGTVRLAGRSAAATIAGSVGHVRLDDGGSVQVTQDGSVSGTVRLAGRSGAATIAGSAGDVRIDRGGSVWVTPDGSVTGTVRLADRSGGAAIAGSVGYVLLDEGGVVSLFPTAQVRATSGVSILSSSGELVVVFESGTGVPGRETLARPDGRIEETGGEPTILFRPHASATALADLNAAVDGPAPAGPFDVRATRDGDAFETVTWAFAPRSRVHEALPAVLLDLNGLPTRFDRMAAARRATDGAWARLEGGAGTREARRSTSTAALSWDYRRWGAQTGIDIPLGELPGGGTGLAGVSMHRRSAVAKLGGDDGRIEAEGTGFGVSGTWTLENGFYADAQLQATWYEADLSSGGPLAQGVRGFGHALGLEAGRTMDAVRGATVTPRARLVHSDVDMKTFADRTGARATLERAESLTGGAGVVLEAPGPRGSLLFGSLDMERELSGDTRVNVSGTELSSSMQGTRLRLEVGGVHEWDDGAWAIEGAVSYGSDIWRGESDYGAGLSLTARF